MATLRDIKRRIKAVHSTKQITRAMKMVSAAKFRRAHERLIEMRPYATRMNAVISSLANSVEAETHPLLVTRPVKKVEVVVFTSDRGLCGAFNSNILKNAVKQIAELKQKGIEVTISTIGRKAYEYYKRRNIQLRKSWNIAGSVAFTNAQEISINIIENYVSEAVDEVILIYNEFKSVIAQETVTPRLLPMAPLETTAEVQPVSNFIYEPNKEELFDDLLPKNVEIQIFSALLESQGSEEAARMTAMENATKSANDMIDSLTLQYNKARQTSITTELMDIVGGVEALKG
ncbi:MAG: ATP synthase F1 subunit gamma [Nitrospiraceae bacterium]|nr:ATP synthase F1 subunit gamma [Nitrospiraceae bacterium]